MGFTLVEMAVVLVVIGLIILAVFPALTAIRMNSARATTQSNLQALMLATATYVQANGCLPCPTVANASQFGNFGFGRVGTALASSTTASACGTCVNPSSGAALTVSQLDGIPPFMSLGLPPSAAHDGWGHWITMRVDPALTNPANLVVPPTAPVACTCSAPVGNACTASPTGCTCSPPVNSVCTPLPAGLSRAGICAPSGSGAGLLSKGNSIGVSVPSGNTQSAAVIFVSHGAAGYGAFLADSVSPNLHGKNGLRVPFPSSMACTATAGYAACNAAGNGQFVNAPTVIGGPDPYDDLLAYADRNTLVSMLGNGSCQTVW